jgi:GMP synthase (glutamine-hydrolysing)
VSASSQRPAATPPSTRPVLLLQHETYHPQRILRALLESEGLAYEECFLYDDRRPLLEPADYHAVLSRGGGMQVHEEMRYPFLVDEKAFLRGVLEAETPFLGICLGSQLLAEIAGGYVFERDEAQVGWLPVDLVTPDPLLAGVERQFVTLQWHSYSWTLPPHARLIAARHDGMQACRVGRAAWGVQFHPDVDAAEMDELITLMRDDLERLQPLLSMELHRVTEVVIEPYQRFCRQLFRNFLGLAAELNTERPAGERAAGS